MPPPKLALSLSLPALSRLKMLSPRSRLGKKGHPHRTQQHPLHLLNRGSPPPQGAPGVKEQEIEAARGLGTADRHSPASCL